MDKLRNLPFMLNQNKDLGVLKELDDWRAEIRSLITDVVKKEFTGPVLNAIEQSHKCRFNVEAKEAKELTHCMGMMSDVGNGSLSAGIEIMRENHKWLMKQRIRSEKISLSFMIVLITSLLTGILYAVWEGFRLLATRMS